MRKSRVRALFPILLGALLGPLSASAAAPDWNTVAAVETVEIVTTDEDGSPRETTIWLAVVDGQGYIRTGDTRWRANIERNPEVMLKIEGGGDYPLRAEFVQDAALKQRVEQSLHDKYGFSDSFVSIFRSGEPVIMRLVPR